MTAVDYNNRKFIGTVNYDDGDMTPETVFHYRQRRQAVWGTFEGGRVAFGTLVARLLEDGGLDMLWQYVTEDGRLVSGSCRSVLDILPDGRYRLHESWTAVGDGEYAGTSVIEEIRE